MKLSTSENHLILVCCIKAIVNAMSHPKSGIDGQSSRTWFLNIFIRKLKGKLQLYNYESSLKYEKYKWKFREVCDIHEHTEGEMYVINL